MNRCPHLEPVLLEKLGTGNRLRCVKCGYTWVHYHTRSR